MIKAVQKNLCELPKANDVAPSKSNDLTLNRDINTTDDDEDDDCVYVSPDEAENGKKITSELHFFNFNRKFHDISRANTHRFGHRWWSEHKSHAYEKKIKSS